MSYRYIAVRYQTNIPSDCLDDARRIKTALDNAGVRTTTYEAYVAWDKYSDSMCAGWLFLPDTDEEIVEALTLTAEDEFY